MLTTFNINLWGLCIGIFFCLLAIRNSNTVDDHRLKNCLLYLGRNAFVEIFKVNNNNRKNMKEKKKKKTKSKRRKFNILTRLRLTFAQTK